MSQHTNKGVDVICATVGLSLLVYFVPFSWIFFVSNLSVKWVLILPGALLTELLRISLAHFQIEMAARIWTFLSLAVSLGILAVMLFLMVRIPRQRLAILLLTLAVSSFFSWAAYGLYRS